MVDPSLTAVVGVGPLRDASPLPLEPNPSGPGSIVWLGRPRTNSSATSRTLGISRPYLVIRSGAQGRGGTLSQRSKVRVCKVSGQGKVLGWMETLPDTHRLDRFVMVTLRQAGSGIPTERPRFLRQLDVSNPRFLVLDWQSDRSQWSPLDAYLAPQVERLAREGWLGYEPGARLDPQVPCFSIGLSHEPRQRCQSLGRLW